MSEQKYLPDPPLRVYAKCRNATVPVWWTRIGDMRCNSFGQFREEWGVEESPDELTVVEHPLNDPEAIAIITAAKSAGGE